MLTFNKVWSVAFAEPFRPFRLRTVEGRTFDVTDPEAFQVGIAEMTFRASDGSCRWERLALNDLESIEPLGQWKHWHVR